MKKFDYVIGNPPFQVEQISEDADGSHKNYAPPIYDEFIDSAISIANRVELIHPARFLFNAGSTSKNWNLKMLNDEHYKVLYYEQDSNKVFPGLKTPIKGGIAITYYDLSRKFGPILVFSKYQDANSIMHKVSINADFISLSSIVYSRTSYRLTEAMHKEHPEAVKCLSVGHKYDMSSNIFERLPNIFYSVRPKDNHEYIKILGRIGNRREYKYIRRDYVNNVDNLDYYKVLVPQANGDGLFGEVISQPLICMPGVGNTETFISIGKFNNISDTKNLNKYLYTKFARMLLSILKVTQNGNKPVWKLIPLQDFTSKSDIDWTKSVHEIDLQLYKKYKLDKNEIEFIESHVKEMK